MGAAVVVGGSAPELETRSGDRRAGQRDKTAGRKLGGGNTRVSAILDRAARRVAVGIGVLVNFIDVPRVVLRGPIWNRLSGAFLPMLEDAVRHELIVSREAFSVVGSAVGEQIAAQGAAELVMDHFLAPRASALVLD